MMLTYPLIQPLLVKEAQRCGWNPKAVEEKEPFQYIEAIPSRERVRPGQSLNVLGGIVNGAEAPVTAQVHVWGKALYPSSSQSSQENTAMCISPFPETALLRHSGREKRRRIWNCGSATECRGLMKRGKWFLWKYKFGFPGEGKSG